MKKLITLFAGAFALLCLTLSCTKDVSESIIGEWDAVKEHIVIKLNGNVIEKTTDLSAGYSIVFKEDKTCYIDGILEDGEEGHIDGRWEYVDGKLVMTLEDFGRPFTDEYEVKVYKDELLLTMSSLYDDSGSEKEVTVTIYFVRR